MKEKNQNFNLLRMRAIRAIMLWPGFPYVFQAITLAAFLTLAVIGWGHFAPEGVNDKLYAKTNIVNLVIWGLWWPLMIWAAVLFGRAWCMICPMELVSNLTERAAGRLGIKQKSLGRLLRSGSLMVILYVVLQLLIAGAHIHRVPAYTSIFLISLLALSVAVSFLFRDRAFCRGFCPVGLLLNVYGRGGMLAVRAGSRSTCAQCADKDCVTARNRTRLDGRSCPSLLNPPGLESNKDCLLCGQCIKSCTQDNMQLVIREPFSGRDAREPHSSWPITLFVMVASGFVLSELASEWKAAQELFLWLPNHVSAAYGLSPIQGWIEGVWTIGIVPAALWTILGGIGMIFQRKADLFETWRRMALPVAVVVSAGHMSKALAKFVSWVGFLPGALSDPLGVHTASAIASKSTAESLPILSLYAVAHIATGLLVAGVLLSIREARLLNPEGDRRQLLPKVALAGLFLSIVVGWGG